MTDYRDPTDNKYLELALAAQATTIVSSEQDLLVLHPWRGTLIQRRSDYTGAKKAPLSRNSRFRSPADDQRPQADP